MAKKITKTEVVKTITITDVRKACQDVGDKLKNVYDNTQDLKSAQLAVSAYSTAVSAAKAQLVYKKLTGKPGEIPFMED